MAPFGGGDRMGFEREKRQERSVRGPLLVRGRAERKYEKEKRKKEEREDQRPPSLSRSPSLHSSSPFLGKDKSPKGVYLLFSFFFCFFAMSLQATTTRNTITLKGSSKIVTEFFAYAVNR